MIKNKNLDFTIADAVEHWINLSSIVNKLNFKTIMEETLTRVCSPIAIAANFFIQCTEEEMH